MDGTIKWFDSEAGYGFIASPSGDVFMHVSAVVGLRPGARVTFGVAPGPHGPMALDIELTPAASPPSSPAGRAITTTMPAADEASFRGVPWRSSPAAAAEREESTPVFDLGDALGFEALIAGIPCRVIYVFLDGQLSRGKYIPQRHSDDQLLTDFLRLETLLNEKYGNPAENEDFWRDPDYARYGIVTAVSHGMLAMYRTWRLPSTEISVSISAEDFDITVAVEYQSRELEAAEERAQRERALRDL